MEYGILVGLIAAVALQGAIVLGYEVDGILTKAKNARDNHLVTTPDPV